ncbi:MAG: gamma-glutamyl-gamma-aminobutyrate hydrolase family protein, partial [Nitrospirales bacterium]
FQDIPSQIDTALAHRQAEPATRLSHLVHVSPRTLLYRITRRSTVRVNSSHHQSVHTVPTSMLVSGVAPDGVIEAIEAPRHPFLLGVQWHPEFLYDRYAMHRRVFLAFVHAARKEA